jgi:hypothetical protein
VYNVAKKTTVNKSEAIRSVLKANPSASAKEVVATLKQTGIDVNEGLVYAVKKHLKSVAAKAPKAKATVQAVPPVHVATSAKIAAPAKIAAHSSNGVLGVGASIAVAKAAAEKVGGWAVLKEIVDALA